MENIVYQRCLRLYEMRHNGGQARERFISSLNEKFDETDTIKALKCLSFAENLNYKHEGLTQKAYLAHSCRVASLIMEHLEDVNVGTIELALVHNVFEVSPGTENLVEGMFGKELSMCLKTLTIDRSKQASSKYLATYYRAIRESSERTRIVKIFDKLDNMFIVCINPHEDIRHKYFEEIQRYVIPLLRLVEPELEDFFLEVINKTKLLGHVAL